MRVKVNKAAQKTKTAEPEDGAHELTNMVVKEVSIVDRAANRRKFLVTKSDQTAQTDDDDIDLTASAGTAATPGADLDAKDAANVEKTEAQKAIEAKDAADAAAYAAEKAKGETGQTAPVPVPASASAPVAVDAAKALDQLAAEAAQLPAPAPAPTKKDDAPTPVVVVPADPVVANPSADKVKTAILAAIGEIEAKVGQWKAAVQAADDKSSDSVSGRPWAVWEYSYYIQRMIDGVCNIGGADWEVSHAAFNAEVGKATAALAAATVTKANNKAITVARKGVLKAVHVGMTHCMGTFDKVMKELDDETAPDESQGVDGATSQPSFAKKEDGPGVVTTTAKSVTPAPVVVTPAAPAPAPVVQSDPAFVVKMAEMGDMLTTLKGVVEEQGAIIAKHRGDISSNAISPDRSEISKGKPNRDNLEWPDDLAPPRSDLYRQRSR